MNGRTPDDKAKVAAKAASFADEEAVWERLDLGTGPKAVFHCVANHERRCIEFDNPKPISQKQIAKKIGEHPRRVYEWSAILKAAGLLTIEHGSKGMKDCPNNYATVPSKDWPHGRSKPAAPIQVGHAESAAPIQVGHAESAAPIQVGRAESAAQVMRNPPHLPAESAAPPMRNPPHLLDVRARPVSTAALPVIYQDELRSSALTRCESGSTEKETKQRDEEIEVALDHEVPAQATDDGNEEALLVDATLTAVVVPIETQNVQAALVLGSEQSPKLRRRRNRKLSLEPVDDRERRIRERSTAFLKWGWETWGEAADFAFPRGPVTRTKWFDSNRQVARDWAELEIDKPDIFEYIKDAQKAAAEFHGGAIRFYKAIATQMEIDFGRASNVARLQKYPVIRDLPRRKTDYDGFVASDAEAVIAQIQHQNAALHVTHPAVQNWGPGSWRTPWPDHRDAVAMGKRGDWYWGPSPNCKKMQYEPECSQNGAATA